jgi:hypothetical protein
MSIDASFMGSQDFPPRFVVAVLCLQDVSDPLLPGCTEPR